MHNVLQSLHPENGVDAEEAEACADGALDTTRGLDFYRKQYENERPTAPALSRAGEWPIQAAAPRNAENGELPLDAKITASEVSITKMPVAPSTKLPPCPGGRSCVMCTTLKQQHDEAKQDWDPDGPGFLPVHQTPCPSTTSAPSATPGVSTAGRTFDNAAAQNNVTLTTLSTVGINGAFNSVQFLSASTTLDTGSPGLIAGAIPEPGTYAMIAAGLVVIGGMARRRQR
jgi:hypothetical protein